MSTSILILAPQLREALWLHLLPPGMQREQAAFLFCLTREEADRLVFEPVDVAYLASSDFAAQYEDYLELTDECRIDLIKKAHKLGASLVEFHSHLGPWPAAFSLSDRRGLKETVHHMRWRLKGRPYVAAVVAQNGFDALVWARPTLIPDQLEGIQAGAELLTPTNASLDGWDHE